MAKGIGGSTGSGGSKGIGGSVGSGYSKGISGDTGGSNNSSGNQNSGGDCFVATAAFGTPWEPEIQILRNWRDSHLRYSSLGRAFIGFYYNKGPVAARFIRRHPAFKKPVRSVIRLIIRAFK